MIQHAEQAIENKRKYGDQKDDVIARSYREGKHIGDIFCSKTIEKYLRRYISDSKKANNNMDLLKAQDFLSRMIGFNKDQNNNQEEIIEK